MTADRFQVRILNEGSREYQVHFLYGDNVVKTPTLDARIRAWQDTHGNPFPPADLAPKRVGIYSHGKKTFRPDVYVLNCTSLNWAQVALMDEGAIKESLPAREQIPVVGVGCTIYTKDEKIIITRRAGPKKVKQCPNMWHVVGGYADLESAVATQSLLPTVYNELGGEAGIHKEDVSMLIPIGAYESTMPGVPGVHVGFFARVLLTADEVLMRAKEAKDAYEGKFFAYAPEELRALLSRTDDVVPTAGATLIRILNTKPWHSFSCTRCRQAIPAEHAQHRLVLARHGETEWNRKNLSVGSKNIPLNEAGKSQAHRHGERLKKSGLSFPCVTASPLMRALETGRIIANYLGIRAIMVDSRLQERCVGIQEGRPPISDWWRYFETEFLPEGAEPYHEFTKRVAEVLQDVTRWPEHRLLITHGLVIIEAIKQIRQWPTSHLSHVKTPSHEEQLTFAFGDSRCSCGNQWFEQF